MNFFSPKYCLTSIIILLCGMIVHATPIKVGMSAALTGPSGHLGTTLLEGIEPTIAHINANGGIQDRPLKLIALDDQYNPKQTVKNTLSLINDHKVDLLFSYVGTPTTLKVTPIILKYNTPLFFPFTGAHVLHEGLIGDIIYHWRPNYWEETKTIVDHLMATKQYKIAIYYQKDAFGQSGLMGIKNALSNQKTTPATIVSYPRGKSFHDDFTDDAKRLLQHEPNAIICISSYEASAGIIKAIRQTHTIPIATISFSDPNSVLKKLNNNPKLMQHLIYSQVVPEKAKINDLSDYTTITKQPFNPIRYEGYLNTIKLSQLLTTHSLNDLKHHQISIENELNQQHTVTLLKATTTGWEPL